MNFNKNDFGHHRRNAPSNQRPFAAGARSYYSYDDERIGIASAVHVHDLPSHAHAHSHGSIADIHHDSSSNTHNNNSMRMSEDDDMMVARQQQQQQQPRQQQQRRRTSTSNSSIASANDSSFGVLDYSNDDINDDGGGDSTSMEQLALVGVNPNDVLCGRGKKSFNHPGNKRFRELISSSIVEYEQATSRLEKSLVVHAVVEEIRCAGGRFMKMDKKAAQWKELEERACKEKVGHAIRDASISYETRRQKKTKPDGSAPASSLYIGGMHSHHASGGSMSSYNEMKMEVPDSLSFHDLAQASFVRGRQWGLHRAASNNINNTASLLPVVLPVFNTAATAPAGGAVLVGPTTEERTAQVHSPVGRLASTWPTTAAGGQRRSQRSTHHQEDEDDCPDEAGFMDHIEQALGPMPPGHRLDPLADLLGLSNKH